MALYLDTEFNGFGGKLISLAIYNSDMPYYHYYGVLWFENNFVVNDWVKQNVVPVLNKKWCTKDYFTATLRDYLMAYGQGEIIYADWPEDFKHLLDQCYGENGAKYVPNLKMELITVPDIHKSKIPHNALEDAKALHLNHMEMINGPVTRLS